ncbi:hypothetical protein EDB85DRAFT_2270472 [Lactarius pseudohatsudake]|nr:hypothetical protein EDB85DRAFT_2270472 [Lactarius pseudohatsudake]
MPGFPVADPRNSIGAAFIGLLVSTMLFGLSLAQTWIYFWHYWKRDRMALKFFVAFIIVMDAFDTILSAYAIYWYLVLNFGNVENLDYVMWAMNMEFAIGPEAIVCAFVQIFYARQVFIVSRSIICPIFIVVSITISFCKCSCDSLGGTCIIVVLLVFAAFGLLFVVKELALRRFSWFHSSLWVMCVGVAAVAMTDLLIAAAMCWSLYRKRTGFAGTDSIITTLMAYSINSGLLTSILSLGVIISSVVSPSTMIWLAFLWVMGKCGVNSLLAMLNSRDFIRERSDANDPDGTFTGRLSMIRFEPPDFSQRNLDWNAGPTFEFPKLNPGIVPSQGQRRSSESFAYGLGTIMTHSGEGYCTAHARPVWLGLCRSYPVESI